MLWAIAVVLGIPLVVTYAHQHVVPRLPTAVLATGLVIVGMLSMTAGVILNGILRQRQESARLSYLRYPAVSRVPVTGCAHYEHHRR